MRRFCNIVCNYVTLRGFPKFLGQGNFDGNFDGNFNGNFDGSFDGNF